MKPSKRDKSVKTEAIISVSLNAADVLNLDVVRRHLATDAATTAIRFALKEAAEKIRRPRKP